MNKRIIAVLLSLAATFTGFNVFGDDGSANPGNVELKEISIEKKESKIDEATKKTLELLHSFGVFEKWTDENVESEKNVTRAEFAMMAYDLFNGNLTAGKCSFGDVSDSDKFYNAVSALSNNGIIDGDENNNFNPNEEITVGQASKIAVLMLGYRLQAEYEGGYYMGYIKLARDNDLYPGGASDSSMTYADVISLMFDITQTDICTVDISNRSISTRKNNTFLNEYYDIYKIDNGYCERNSYSGTLGKSACQDNTVVIDGIEYADNDNIATEYLGYNVSFYYHDDEYEKAIVYIKPYIKVTQTTISTSDIIDDSSLTTSCIPYETESKDKKFLLDEDVTVIFNGVETSSYTVELFKSADGSIVAVDNNSDNKIDTLIIKSYEYYIVDKVDVNNNMITDKFERIFDCAPDDDPEKITWRDADGQPVDIKDLYEWDTLAIERSVDGSYFKVTVLKKFVEGTINSVSGANNKTEVVIDDIKYAVSSKYYQGESNKFPAEVKVGSDVFAVLNLSNEIILLDASASEYKWGILMKVVQDEENEDTYIARLIAADGLKYEYRLSDKVIIDGKKFTHKNSSYDGIIAALQQGDVLTYLSDEEKDNNPGYITPSNFVYQLIRYEATSDGEIKSIDTASPDYGKPTEELIQLSPSKIDTKTSRGIRMGFKSNDNTFNKIIKASASTICFCVPSPLSYGDESAFVVTDYTYFKNDKSEVIIPYGVSFEDTMGIKAIVMIDSFRSSISSSSELLMFDEAEYMLTADDDPVVSIKAWYGNAQNTLLCNIDAYEKTTLNKGDLFRYSKDARGFVNELKKVFDLETETILDTEGVNISNSNAPLRYLYAGVYDKSDLGVLKMASVYENGKFSIVNPVNIEKNNLLELHTFNLYNAFRGVAVYNEEGKKITAGTIDDVKPYKKYKPNYSKVLLITMYQEARYLYIYNLENDD